MTVAAPTRPLGGVHFPVGALAQFNSDHRRTTVVNDYDPIARVFDEVMGHDFHGATHHLRHGVAAARRALSTMRCLDLCCGTGLFFARLAADHQILGWGIDKSIGQIEQARRRAANPRGASLTYYQGDILEAKFPDEMDLVTINFDALNHVLGRLAWRHVFERAYGALRPQGNFLFDINLPDRLLSDWNAPEVIVKETVTYIQLGLPPEVFDGGVKRKTPIIIFERNGSGFVRRDALIEQYALPVDISIAMLKSVGFRNIKLIQEPSKNPIGHIFNKNRAFICATR